MSIRYLSGINVDNNVLFVDSANDRVGIGTGSPTYNLDVVGEGRTSSAFMAGGAINIDSNLAIQISSAGAGTQRWIGINKNNGYGLIIGYVENAAALNGVGAYIRQVTSDPIHFLIDNSTTAMSIVSGGNVGIGTAAPGYRLHVKDSTNVGTIAIGHDSYPGLLYSNAGSGEFRIDNRASAGVGYITFYPNGQAGTIGSEAMRITAGGNVGIGTTAPSYKLDVDGGSALVAARIYNSSNAATVVYVGDSGNTDYSDIILQTNSGTGEIFKAGTGYTSYGGALALNIYNSNGAIAFHPNSTANAMFIATNGNVGIGTTAPIRKLSILDAGSSFQLRVGYSNDYYYDIGRDPNDGYFDFYGNQTGFIGYRFGGVDGTRLSITPSGNVGIGTTAPKSKLQIVGPTLTTNNENTYAVWVSDTGDDTKALLLGYDLVNDIGVIQAVDQALAWKNISIASNDGNVGIGTTAPVAKLDVNGTGKFSGQLNIVTNVDIAYGALTGNYIGQYYNGTDLHFYNGTGGANFFSITRSTGVATFYNNVGIGTTAPDAKLDVRMSGSNGTFGRGRAGNLNLQNTNTSVTQGGWLSISGYMGNTVANYEMGMITGGKDTSAGDNNYAGHLSFWTCSGGANGEANSGSYERMRINGSGNVGIGTTAPKQKLIVEGVLATKASGIDAYYSYLRSNWAENNAFELGISEDGASNFHKLITSSNYYFGSTLQFWTSDTEKMRITSSGNVGIGTTSPLSILDVYQAGQPQLRVRGTTGANHLYQDSVTGTTTSDGLFVGIGGDQTGYIYHYEANPLVFATSNAERMRITAAGNVGIGTTAPNAKLAIVASNGSTNAALINDTPTTAGTEVSYLSYFGTNNAGTMFATPLAQIGAISKNGGVAYGDLVFRTTPASGATAERVRITADGNVGIGTTSPGDKLSLAGSTSTTFGLSLEPSGWNNAKHRLTVPVSGDTSVWSFNYNGSAVDSSSYATSSISITQGVVLFSTGAANTAPSERMRIAPSGNVLIGTTTDSGLKLDVAGIIRGTSTNPFVIRAKTSSGSDSRISFEDPVNASNDSVWVGSTGHNLTFGAFYDERMRITSAGNVGIGTTAPTNKLHVVGIPRFDAEDSGPSTTTAPVTQDKYIGFNSAVLTDPTVWLRVNISGTEYLIPAYSE